MNDYFLLIFLDLDIVGKDELKKHIIKHVYKINNSQIDYFRFGRVV